LWCMLPKKSWRRFIGKATNLVHHVKLCNQLVGVCIHASLNKGKTPIMELCLF